MTSRTRKTTFEERIEITEYIIARENDYQAAIEKYGVSYQQIYQWIKKYNKHGIDGLKDRRGHIKTEDGLSKIELLKLENKRLKARNEYLEVAGEIRKKLEEPKHRYEYFR